MTQSKRTPASIKRLAAVPKTRINHVAMLELVRALQEPDGHSCRELAEITGLNYKTVLPFCATAHRMKLVYIKDWDVDARGRHTVIIYAWGDKRDAPSKAQTNNERMAQYRKRKAQLEFNSLFGKLTHEIENKT